MSIENYYKYYLDLHQNKWNRRLHFIGQLVTLVSLYVIIYNGYWWWLFIIPFIVYPYAWSGHFFFEKNKPAAWTDPIKSKICDWYMFIDICLGRVDW